MAQKIEINLYRHKEYKNIYLIRDWSLCGGGENTDFYKTTTNLKSAIENMYNFRKDDFSRSEDFMYWNNTFNGKLKAKAILEKEMDFDGYKGTLKKELMLPIDEFEKILLLEQREDKKSSCINNIQEESSGM